MCGSDAKNHKIIGKRLNQSQGFNPRKKIGLTTTIAKCKNCNLIFSNPQPIPKNIHDHYGVLPENYWKEEYFILEDTYFKDEIDTVKNLIKIDSKSKALDIGAGVGKCMIALNNAGFDTFGIEPSEPFYSRAIGKMEIDNSKLKMGSIEEAQYPSNEFDFITFGAVLEHLYNPSEAIEKAVKWLKPGGVIHIEVPSSNWLISKIINFSYKIQGLDYVGNLSPMHVPYHLHEFDLKSFVLNGKLNNYSVVKHQYFICETYMPKIFDLIFKPYMKWTNTGMQLVVWLKKNNSDNISK